VLIETGAGRAGDGTGPATGTSSSERGRPRGLGVAVAAVVVAAALAVPLLQDAPQVLVGFVAVLAVVALVAVSWYRPILGTYVYVTSLPFLAGIDRGALLPLVRPNEALLVLVVLGALLGWAFRWLRDGTATWPVPHPVDAPLAIFLALYTVWPICWMMLRGLTPTGGDLAAILPVPKLVALFLLVRLTVRTDAEVTRLLRLVVWPSVLVAVISVLQVLAVAPVLSLLSTFWVSATDDPADLAQRGTTTLGSPLSTGDVLVLALVVVICCGLRGLLGRRERLVAGGLLLVGVLATAQFTAWLTALVAGVAILVRFPHLRRPVRRFWPVPVVLLLIAIPVVVGRLQDVTALGVPVSWATRWDNLSHYYLPVLGGFRFLLGIGPSSVLPAQETWREVVYLESGYLEFLWVGGLPLLLGFLWFTVAVLRATRSGAAVPGPRGAVAEALRITWWTLLVSTVLDPHLTLRGSGDLLFVLLALLVGPRTFRTRAPEAPPRPPPAEVWGRTVTVVPRQRVPPGQTPPEELPTGRVEAAARRALDVVGAAVGLVLVAVPMVVIAAVVRLDSPGPALLRQRRVGVGQRSFVLLKFRTMYLGGSDEALRALVAAELRGEDTAIDGSTKLAGDARVTRFGAWLRRTSLDELPQLINVLRGEMSLVGPRPCLEWEAPMFPPAYRSRFAVRPGLTGLWQVEGRSTMGTLEMLELDAAYVQERARRGVGVDLAILARTVPVLVRGDGAR
jgi:lipopolysaccharide/colanic/teichoic acid biosynthesis glycosyltransferase